MAQQPVRIDEQLNLIVPVDRSDGKTVYVHASPISRMVYDQYWWELAKTFAAIYGEGFSVTIGPRISARLLKRVSVEAGTWDGEGGAEVGLLGEIRRLANVVVPSPNGWQTIPLDDAMRRKMIDEDDIDEIEGVLVFFSVGWRLHLKKERRTIMDGAVKLWGASTSSQTLSAFIGSLPTSIETASTGETAPAPSSPPSLIGRPGPASRPVSGNGSIASPGGQH